MRGNFQLFITVAKAAALISIAECFGPLLAIKMALTHVQQGALTLIAIILATGIATWWMFRRLQSDYTRPEARAVSTTFAILSPVSLAVAMPLSLMPAGYAEVLFGSRFFGVGAFAGIVIVTTSLDFLLCRSRCGWHVTSLNRNQPTN